MASSTILKLFFDETRSTGSENGEKFLMESQQKDECVVSCASIFKCRTQFLLGFRTLRLETVIRAIVI